MSSHQLLGLHHVTATVDDAQADLDFCLDRLGMRLVKKTVNFDNTGVYHFYYGTERGTPGTIWTTFPYGAMGVRRGTKGAGQVVATALSVPRASIDAWCTRLEVAGVPTTLAGDRFGEPVLQVTDPSGLVLELIGAESDTRSPWTGNGVDASQASRGIHSVSMTVFDAGPTVAFMTKTLGYRVLGQDGPRTRLAAGGEAPGHFIDVVVDPNARPALNGIGTVHHVAMAIGTPDEQRRLRDDLAANGVGVTPVMDRCYFQSIYFREPGGVLFEVATAGPGFAIDEELEALGRDLKLPPWEESNRPRIAAGLPTVTYR
jgi:glyoxalase family protein